MNEELNTCVMPNSNDDGRVVTLNKMGFMHPVIDSVTKQFIDFCSKNGAAKVLEIGASYGFASEIALSKGVKLYINDLDKRHLQIFKSKIKDPKLRDNITLLPGNFPEEIELESESFEAILAVRVLHFFAPRKLEEAAVKMNQALKKGGKIYIVADTPYQKSWAAYIPIYEQKKSTGDPYPGYFNNLSDFNQNDVQYLPDELHFLDPEVLSKIFERAGFMVLLAVFLDRKDYPASLRLDGRESVGFIAVKVDNTSEA